MDDLQERVAALKVLASRRPTPERRAQIRDALNDKFEGVQSVAIKVLGAWRDAESREMLRAFLVGAFERPQGWAILGVAIKTLAPCLDERDADWALDLYYGLAEIATKHMVLTLVIALPPQAARKRLIAMLRDADPVNRQAAVKAIGNMAYRDKRELISPLRDDPDKLVRDSARLLAGRA